MNTTSEGIRLRNDRSVPSGTLNFDPDATLTHRMATQPSASEKIDQQVTDQLSPHISSLHNPVLSRDFVVPGTEKGNESNSSQASTGTGIAAHANVPLPSSLSSLSDSGLRLPQPEIQKKDLQQSELHPMELNYGNRVELLPHKSLLTLHQNTMLTSLETKRVEYSEGIPAGYFDNGYLILGLAPEKYAYRFTFCGRRDGLKKIDCKQWQFCPICAQHELKCSWARYANVFHKGTFHYLTLSFEGNLSFEATTCTHILDYWDAINGAIAAKCKSGEWPGCYWVDELAVNSFLPLRVLPHAHAIIDADSVDQDTLDELSETITGFTGLGGQNAEILLKPSLKLEPIPTEADFHRILSYFSKAVSLVKPYNEAWRKYASIDPRQAEALNREARELIEGVPILLPSIVGKKRKWCKGTFDPRTRCYIGKKFTKDKQKKGKKTRKR